MDRQGLEHGLALLRSATQLETLASDCEARGRYERVTVLRELASRTADAGLVEVQRALNATDPLRTNKPSFAAFAALAEDRP